MDIETVARLARISLTPDEAARYGRELDAILAYVATLDTLNLDDVAPTAHVVNVTTPFRDDVVAPPLSAEEALSNAPERNEDTFIVPKVV